MASWTLQCGACGDSRGPTPLATVCECGKPLLARLDFEAQEGDALPDVWAGRARGMWRFRELLPLHDGEAPVSLGEGETPLLEATRLGPQFDGIRVLVKDEGRNPTGSFKDRGLSAAVTRAVRDGADSLVVPSAGNAAAALAAYAARAGVPVRIFIPGDTPEGVERRCRHFGAEIVAIDGLIDECGRRAARHSEQTGAFNLSTLREPYRIEGKKTMMLEIVESLGWRAPDAIVYPTGGGTGLIASWKVLGELAELGLVERTTRLYSVQSSGCAPIVRAWEEDRNDAPPWEGAATEAFGLRVPAALGDFLILEALRESRGGAVRVDDSEMRVAAGDLGRLEGINASIEGGATLAAARKLRREGNLRDGDTVVLFNTASLLTY
ncbi:MAG: threonine synthase [Gemmatimonadota bacterium]